MSILINKKSFRRKATILGVLWAEKRTNIPKRSTLRPKLLVGFPKEEPARENHPEKPQLSTWNSRFWQKVRLQEVVLLKFQTVLNMLLRWIISIVWNTGKLSKNCRRGLTFCKTKSRQRNIWLQSSCLTAQKTLLNRIRSAKMPQLLKQPARLKPRRKPKMYLARRKRNSSIRRP